MTGVLQTEHKSVYFWWYPCLTLRRREGSSKTTVKMILLQFYSVVVSVFILISTRTLSKFLFRLKTGTPEESIWSQWIFII